MLCSNTSHWQTLRAAATQHFREANHKDPAFTSASLKTSAPAGRGKILSSLEMSGQESQIPTEPVCSPVWTHTWKSSGPVGSSGSQPAAICMRSYCLPPFRVLTYTGWARRQENEQGTTTTTQQIHNIWGFPSSEGNPHQSSLSPLN